MELPIKQIHQNSLKPSKKQIRFYGRIFQQGTWKKFMGSLVDDFLEIHTIIGDIIFS
jgi:hypothetical protein